MPGRLEQLDKNFVTAAASDGLLWHDVRTWNLEGQGWKDTQSPFDRLPARAQAIVRPEVWELSQQTAGLHVALRNRRPPHCGPAGPSASRRWPWTTCRPAASAAWICICATAAHGAWTGVGRAKEFEQFVDARGTPARSAALGISRVSVVFAALQRHRISAHWPGARGRHQTGPALARSAGNPSFSMAPPSPRAAWPRARGWHIRPSSVACSIGRPSISVSRAMAPWTRRWHPW